jgi:hypothetical protein
MEPASAAASYLSFFALFEMIEYPAMRIQSKQFFSIPESISLESTND